MKTHLEAVVKCLDSQKIKYNLLQQGKTAILIIPQYGRVLGLWSDIENDNHFWLNQKFLEGCHDPNWANPGGHRIWLAPEREFFISDLNKPFETYKVPVSIDPGEYKFAYDNLSLQLSNTGTLRSFAKNMNCDFNLTRTASLLSDDKLQKFTSERRIRIAGYEDNIELKTEGCPAGVWSLIQVPLEGTISLPILKSESHKVFFGEMGKLVKYNNGFMNLHLKPHSQQNFKLSFKASDCGSLITYLYTYPDGFASLIIKQFKTAANDGYVDTPWNEPNDKGYAVQFFCGGGYGFAEIETHAPVLQLSNGWQSNLKMTVLSFYGPVDLCVEYRQICLGTANKI